jgi:hypothetical protein
LFASPDRNEALSLNKIAIMKRLLCLNQLISEKIIGFGIFSKSSGCLKHESALQDLKVLIPNSIR